MFHHLLNDLRLGLRRLRQTTAASIIVVTTLSVGIGLCALMWSVIDGAILPTMPFENGDRIVRVTRSDGSRISTDTYLYWVERQRLFEELGMAAEGTIARGAPSRMGSSRSASRGRAVRSARVRYGTWRPAVHGLPRVP